MRSGYHQFVASIIWVALSFPCTMAQESQEVGKLKNTLETTKVTWNFKDMAVPEIVTYLRGSLGLNEEYQISVDCGQLFVRHRPDVQRQIAAFLAELRRHYRPREVGMEVNVVQVENARLGKFPGLLQSPVLDDQSVAALDEAIAQGGSKVITQTLATAQHDQLIPIVQHGELQGSCFYLRPLVYTGHQAFVQVVSLSSDRRNVSDLPQELVFHKAATALLLPCDRWGVVAIAPAAPGHSLISLVRLQTPAWEPLPPLEPPADPVTQALRDKLKSLAVTVDFQETPLPDVLNFLHDCSGINIVLDPRVLLEPNAGQQKVSLCLRQIALETMLALLADMQGLTYRIEHGVIVMGPKNCGPLPELKFYDVRDLCLDIRDLPAEEFTANASGLFRADQHYVCTDAEQLVDLIKNNIARESWDRENIAIDEFRGIMIVRQSTGVHAEIARLLAQLRQIYSRKMRPVLVWTVLAPSRPGQLEPSLTEPYTTITLLTCMNEQRAHVGGGLVRLLALQPPDLAEKTINETATMDITPVIQNNDAEIEVTLRLLFSGPLQAQRQTTVLIPNDKSRVVATLPGSDGELNLWLGAAILGKTK